MRPQSPPPPAHLPSLKVSPLPRLWERKGPAAQRWEGEGCPQRRQTRSLIIASLLLSLLCAPKTLAAPRLQILAAENMYGAVASALAGPQAQVASVMSNPAQDPHDFEASPAVARQVAGADLVILNGLDYDPWMDRLLAAAMRPGRDVLRVADLIAAAPGGNPHLWYAPTTMASVAESLTARLVAQDAPDAPLFQQREKAFLARLQQVQGAVADLHAHFAGQPVTATEPVFGLMARAIGLAMRNERFQYAVMNGTEPRADDVIAMETDLRQHRVRVLFHNAQVSDVASTRLLRLARAAAIPVVGVTETMPADSDYAGWILAELAATKAALSQRE